ncbi:hypothetical protein PG995_006563 [Apiospora arundinis]
MTIINHDNAVETPRETLCRCLARSTAWFEAAGFPPQSVLVQLVVLVMGASRDPEDEGPIRSLGSATTYGMVWLNGEQQNFEK